VSIALDIAFTIFNTSLSSSARWIIVTGFKGGITGPLRVEVEVEVDVFIAAAIFNSFKNCRAC